MRFDSSMVPTSYLRDYCPPGKLPEGLEVEVLLKGKINSRGNFVAVLPDDSDVMSGYGPEQRFASISITWRSLFALPREQVAVKDEGPPPGSVRVDRAGLLWMRVGDAWTRLSTTGHAYAVQTRLLWPELQRERGPMKPIPEEIGGAR